MIFSFLWENAIDEQGKSPASDRKRRRLREEGVTTVSPLILKSVTLLWFCITLMVVNKTVLPGFAKLTAYCFNANPAEIDIMVCGSLLLSVLWPVGLILLFLPIMTAVAASIQVGRQWTWKSFKEYFKSGNSIGGRFTGNLKPGGLLLFIPSLVIVVLVSYLFVFRNFFSLSTLLASFQKISIPSICGILLEKLFFLVVLLALLTFVFGGMDYLLRRRRFEISAAMTPEEEKKERIEESGHPELRAARLDKATKLINGGAPELAVVHPVVGTVLMGRHNGKGRPLICARFGVEESRNMMADFRSRGIIVSYNQSVVSKLVSVKVGEPVSVAAMDEIAALYQKYKI
jgi:flagellar biosynthesis protein FlhB